jgi:alpha-glucosidase
MNEPSNFCEYPCPNPGAEANSTNSTQAPGLVHERGLAPRQNGSLHTGLPNRNLLDPLYKIKNAAGVLSNKTANTSLIHQGGWAEYDTHNL